MSQTSLFHYQDQYEKGLCRKDSFIWTITGAAASNLVPQQSAVLSTYGALTQAQIDAFLGSTNEFNYLDFDATAMGADMFAAIFNYDGQVQSVSSVVATCYSSTGGSTQVIRQTEADGLAASTVETAAELSSLGNVAVKVNFGNTPDFDGLTSGTIQIDIYWVSK